MSSRLHQAGSGRSGVHNHGPMPMGVGGFPAHVRSGNLGYDGVAEMEAQVELARSDFQRTNKRMWGASEEMLERSEILFRRIFGASPSDMIQGQVLGKKITKSRIELCDPDAGGPSFRMAVELANEPLSTQNAHTAGDRAIVRSFWDSGLHGYSTGIISPPMLEEMLTVRSRGISFLPWMAQGFAPDLTYEGLIFNTNAVRELFDGTDYANLKSGILPRKEGTSGTAEIRAAFENFNFTVRGYMLHTSGSLEALTSRGGIVTGAWQKALAMIMEGLGYIDEWDFIQALFNGMELGYTRRRKASDNTWDVATAEVPRGKATFIEGNASKYWCWYDSLNEKFYLPGATTNYRKYANAQAHPSGIYPTTGVKMPEIFYKLAEMQDKRGRKLEAISLPTDMLIKYGLDERSQDKNFISGNPRLMGEPGYVGNVPLPGVAESVALFKYQPGAVPVFQTGDSVAKNIQYLVWGGELGKAVTNHMYWPATLQLDKEYTTVTVNSKTVTRPTNQEVGTSYSMAGIEPYDLDSISMIKVMNGAPV